MAMRVAAVIAAAGLGRRMQRNIPKTYLPLAGKPVLLHTLEVFEKVPEVQEVVVVVHPEDLEYCHQEIIEPHGLKKVWRLVPGGRERQDSVYNALRILQKEAEALEIILVHDGARPLVEPALVRKVVAAARRHGAAIPALPCQDTLKRVHPKGEVLETVNRQEYYQVQTPQGFRAPLLFQAFQEARAKNFYATDEAALVEALGKPVRVIPGSPFNLKITTPEDLLLAEAILRLRQAS